MPRVPAISLFTGAGGLDIGALQAGCKPLLCVDSDQASIETLQMNRVHGRAKKLCADVRSLTGDTLLKLAGLSRGSLPLVIGGPPCQSFSKAGYWTSTGEEALRRRNAAGVLPSKRTSHRAARAPELDERSHLVQEYLRLVDELQPKAFVFENVPSLLHPSNKQIFLDFLNRSAALDYAISYFPLDAADYGVAQHRHRIFVVGLKCGRVIDKPLSEITSHKRGSKHPVSVSEVIHPYRLKKYAESGESVTGRWSHALKQIPPGSNYKALTSWAGHPKPLFVAETRFWNFLLKLHPQRPSWTITANPGPWVGPFHWTSRRLRTVEMAAIQGFPDGYNFSGDRRSRIRQIGNAVPPQLAAAVLRAVLEEIE